MSSAVGQRRRLSVRQTPLQSSIEALTVNWVLSRGKGRVDEEKTFLRALVFERTALENGNVVVGARDAVPRPKAERRPVVGDAGRERIGVLDGLEQIRRLHGIGARQEGLRCQLVNSLSEEEDGEDDDHR